MSDELPPIHVSYDEFSPSYTVIDLTESNNYIYVEFIDTAHDSNLIEIEDFPILSSLEFTEVKNVFNITLDSNGKDGKDGDPGKDGLPGKPGKDGMGGGSLTPEELELLWGPIVNRLDIVEGDIITLTNTVNNLSGNNWFYLDQYGNLATNYNLYSTKEISAYGLGSGGSNPGGEIGGATNLDSLTDVIINSPSLAGGQFLIYDIAVDGGKWVNKTIDSFAAAEHTHPWSSITNTPTTLADYGITEGFVTLNTDQVITGLKTFTNGIQLSPEGLNTGWKIYSILNEDVEELRISHNGIKIGVFTEDGFYSTGEISAYDQGTGSSGPGEGGASILDDLNDVLVTSVQTNLILLYVGGFWKNVSLDVLNNDYTLLSVFNQHVINFNEHVNNTIIHHTHFNKSIIDNLTQTHLDILAKFAIDGTKLKILGSAYATQELSAYGIGAEGGTGGAINLNTLTDVTITEATENLILQFKDGLWKNVTTINLDTQYVKLNDFSNHTSNSSIHITSSERANWNTAYGWGNHAGVYYTNSEIDNKLNLKLNNSEFDSFIEYFNDLFILDGDKIKALKPLYSVGEISAYGIGSGGGSGGVINLNNLTDVEITSPIINQILLYDGTNWINVSSINLSEDYALLGHTHPISDIVNLSTTLASKEPSFVKNTAFNKNFGVGSNDVAPGNHVHPYLPLDGGTMNNKNLVVDLNAALLNGQDWTYFQKKGENLITNGNGELESNYNFTSFIFDSSEKYNSNGLFKYEGLSYIHISTDEFIIIDTNSSYKFELYVKSLLATGTYYMFIKNFDSDELEIIADHHMYKANTLTTLTQDLKNGDTIIYLYDVENWNNSGEYYERSVIFWNYINSSGYKYPPLTYSRNYYSNFWNTGSINYNNNTITLREPWSNGTIPSGTLLSNGNSGNSYKYIFGLNGEIIPTTWTKYTHVINGVDYSGTNISSKFAPGTHKIKFGIMANYNNVYDILYLSNLIFKISNDAESIVTKLTGKDLSVGSINMKFDIVEGTSVFFQHTSSGNQIDIITSTVNLTCDYKGDLYNNASESSATILSPTGVEWNGDGFLNLNNIRDRYYSPLNVLIQEDYGDKSSMIGEEIIMHIKDTDLYYKIVFSNWDDYGNFSYTRTQLTLSSFANLDVMGKISANSTIQTTGKGIFGKSTDSGQTLQVLGNALITGSVSASSSITASKFYSRHSNNNEGTNLEAGYLLLKSSNNIGSIEFAGRSNTISLFAMKNPVDGNEVVKFAYAGNISEPFGYFHMPASNSRFRIGLHADTYTDYMFACNGKGKFLNDLDVTGNITATGEITAYSTSDERLKSNVVSIANALETVNKLNPVSYNWNDKAKELNPNKTDKTDTGLIAQELQEVLPNIVGGMYDGEYLGIDYVKIIPYLISAIKELSEEVKLLKMIKDEKTN